MVARAGAGARPGRVIRCDVGALPAQSRNAELVQEIERVLGALPADGKTNCSSALVLIFDAKDPIQLPAAIYPRISPCAFRARCLPAQRAAIFGLAQGRGWTELTFARWFGRWPGDFSDSGCVVATR